MIGSSSRPRAKSPGFTLIEVLMILGLLTILAVVSVSVMTDSADEGRFATTMVRMKKVRDALIGDHAYLGDIGGLPSAVQGLNALLVNPSLPAYALDQTTRIASGWNGPYLDASDDLTDGWGTAFLYDPISSPATIKSLGADRAVGGTGLNQDIVLQIPDTLKLSTVYGVILNSGAVFSSDAEVEFYYPDGSGALATSSVTSIIPADNGAFVKTGIPRGIRSVMLYLPSKASPVKTYGPFVVPINQPQTLIKLDYGKATLGTCPAAPQVFSYTGSSQALSVPTGCTSGTVKMWGAGGGGSNASSLNYSGGNGGSAFATLHVSVGVSYSILVGGGGSAGGGVASGGFGGGGAGQGLAAGAAFNGGGGGGRTALFAGAVPILVAGGGGGAGGGSATDGQGGHGGGTVGLVGGGGTSGGGPGTAAAAGDGGVDSGFGAGNAGISAQGGDAGNYGGGGGGGFYGGGGGSYSGSDVGGGGGGSSYLTGTDITGGTTAAGSGAGPGNSGDTDRGTAGVGGAAATAGSNGLIVIYWTP